MNLSRDETGKLVLKTTPIEIDVPNVGPTHFRHVSMKSVENLNKEIERIADDRELIVQVLDEHSAAELSADALRALSDEQLHELARDWAAKPGTLGAELDMGNMPSAFRGAFSEKLARVNETTARAAKSLGALAREGMMLTESLKANSVGALARERMALTESWAARDQGLFLAAERLRREYQPLFELNRQLGPALSIYKQIDEQAKLQRSLLSSPAFSINQSVWRQIDEQAKLHRSLFSSPTLAIGESLREATRHLSLLKIPEAISLAGSMQDHASLQLVRNAAATDMVQGLGATMRAAHRLELAAAAGSAAIPKLLASQWGGAACRRFGGNGCPRDQLRDRDRRGSRRGSGTISP